MDIIFWSGGKDAYLACEFYRQQYPNRTLKLLTTYSKSSEVVPYQNIPIDHIKQQAEALALQCILVALPDKCPNYIYLKNIRQALENQKKPVEHLIFGDWYLQDIRSWREKQFEKAGYTCRFPIWEKSLDDLLAVLMLKPVKVRISAVSKEYRKFIRVGEIYDHHFVRQLPKEIDPMGEKGEFHTEVIFKK